MSDLTGGGDQPRKASRWAEGLRSAPATTWDAPPLPARRFARADETPAPAAAWALAGPAELRVALRRRRRRVWWARWRRPVAAVAVAVALVVGVRGWRAGGAQAGPTVDVWVAARDLPAGAHVAPGDQRRVAWPAGLVPAAALRAPASGVLGGAMAAGEPFTATRLLGPGALTGQAPDVVALAFPVPAALAAVVHAGDRLRLVPSGRAGAEESGGTATDSPAADAPLPGSEDVVVLRGAAAPGAGDAGGLLGAGQAPGDDAGSVTVVLGVPGSAVARLARWDPQRVLVTLLPAAAGAG